MSDEKRFIYVPQERRSVLLRVCSTLFCIGTAVMWISRDRFGFEKGDLLIMSGVAVLLITLSFIGRRAERRAAADSETLRRIREETGKGDYNSDIFYGK
ncbi:MAG: hypothetical protein K2N26_09260 [Oscillospiraceae bacterium]|nr:hypothetical protein [Oscillospiraceae bacterium]MDE7279897.1 hypothetical protein [Oscillospiraceae bacterium]